MFSLFKKRKELDKRITALEKLLKIENPTEAKQEEVMYENEISRLIELPTAKAVGFPERNPLRK